MVNEDAIKVSTNKAGQQIELKLSDPFYNMNGTMISYDELTFSYLYNWLKEDYPDLTEHQLVQALVEVGLWRKDTNGR